MPLGDFEKSILRLRAVNRNPESYIAGHQQKIDQLFLGNRPLNELAAFFPNQEAVLVAYAERMARFYSQHRQIQYCACCGRHSPELSVVFDWRGVYQTRGMACLSTVAIVAAGLLHHLFHFLLPSKTIIFSTTHGFCRNCFDLMQRRRIISVVLKPLCLALIVLGAMMLAACIVVTIYFLFPHPAITTIVITSAILCGGLGCLVAGFSAEDHIVRWCLPKSLRQISKSPFEMIGCRAL